jgi:urea carboxylase
MEGPGGYQFVGRTIQMWNRYRNTPDFHGSQRWLLRFFDQLRFFPVSAEELLDLRRDFAVGRYQLDITETSLSLADHRRWLAANRDSIDAFKQRQQQAFDEERSRWEASGEFTRGERAAARPAPAQVEAVPVPDGHVGVATLLHGAVARVAAVGDTVAAGDTVVVIEAMKTETAVASPASGRVTEVRCRVGEVVGPGLALLVVAPA